MYEGTWTLRPCPRQEVRELAQALGLSETTASVLVRRGYGDPEKAKAFLAAEPPEHDPRSGLGDYLVRHWERLALVNDESLVYWLRKLIFRGAWLDQRVKENLLEVDWDEETADFGYREPYGGRALLELAPVPSWHDLQFRR